MPHPSTAVRFAAVALLGLFGCVFDTSVQGVPRIRCQGNAQCPSGMTCREAVGRCLPTDPPEKVAPTIEERLVFPDIGSYGQRFSLGLRASEPLLEPPNLHVVGSDGRELPFVRDAAELPEREYRFFYDAPAAAPAGVPEGVIRVTADLIDAVGNTSERLEVGSFSLDFTAPQILSGAADVTLSPGTDNPLAVVSALAEGSTARLSFVSSEPLLDVQLSTNVPGLNLVRTGGEGTSYVFAGYLSDAGLVEAQVAARVAATDRAGNPILDPALELRPGLWVDTVAPPAPRTTTPRAVVYTRAPLGLLDGRAPFFEVEGAADSAEPNSALFVREPGSDGVVARAEVSDAGSFGPVSLGSADRPAVVVSAVDSAGNESPRVEVKDLSYVASLRGKVAGSTVENPHRLELRQLFGPAVLGESTEVDVLPAAALGAASWRRRTPHALGPQTCAVAASDLGRGRVVALPASAGGSPWEWNGLDWRRLAASDGGVGSGPPAGPGFAAWDEARERLVYLPLDGNLGTWELDGDRWLHRPVPGPSLTADVAYWPRLGRVMAVSPFGTLWSWSGAGWSYLPSNTTGGRGAMVSLSADRLSGALLAIDDLGQTHRFDTQWVQLAVDAGLTPGGATAPQVRLVSDPGTLELWLVEEPVANSVALRRWLGADAGWSDARIGSTTFKTGTCRLFAALDPTRGALLLHDSAGATVWLDADGGLAPAVAPLDAGFLAGGAVGARGAVAPAFGHPAFLVPGATGDETQVLLWTGQRFRALPPLPAGRLSFAGVTGDPIGGGLLVHGGARPDGGASGETWRLDGDGGWKQLPGGGPAVSAAAFGWSAGHGGALLHGGLTGPPSLGAVASAATWLLPADGGAWTSLAVSSADPAAFHQLSCDDTVASCMLGAGTSGGSTLGRLWRAVSDGGVWESSGFQPYPSPAAGYGWARLPQLPWPLAAGGLTQALSLGAPGVWAVTGSGMYRLSWFTDAEGDGDPAGRVHHALVHDPGRQVTVMFGGALVDGGAAPLDEPWELAWAGARPAAVFTLDLARAQVRRDAAATGLRLQLVAWGAGDARDGGQVSDVDVSVATGGRWTALGRLDPDAGAALLVDPTALRAAVHGQSALRAAVAPTYGNLRGPITLQVQRFDVVLDYRLP